MSDTHSHLPLTTLGLGLLAVFVGLAASACRDTPAGSNGHGHGHQSSAHPDHPHGGDGHSATTHSAIEWGDHFELFVEYPTPITGKEAEFAIHVSHLDGYRPAKTGTVAVVLTGTSDPSERFKATEPARNGLFEVGVSPQYPGNRQLLVTVRGPDQTERFNLGTIRIHKDHPDDHSHTEKPTSISFSKEQQWKVKFQTGTVTSKTLRDSFRAQGVVRPSPSGRSRLIAPFRGRLVPSNDPRPEVGSRVKKGTVIARLAPTPDASMVPGLEAEKTQAKARLRRRRRDVERLRQLAEKNAVPKKKLLDAESELEIARAGFDSASRRLRQIRAFKSGNREETFALRAPISGTLQSRGATAGEYVKEGQPIAKIVDPSDLRLEVRIPEAHANRQEQISGVWFAPNRGGETVALTDKKDQFLGHLENISNQTRTSSAWFLIPPQHKGLMPGQYHRVHVWTGAAQTSTAVPTSAILTRKGISTVYVQTGGETFERRIVETGVRDRGWVQITDGLESNQRIVTKGAYYISLASATSGAVGHHH